MLVPESEKQDSVASRWCKTRLLKGFYCHQRCTYYVNLQCEFKSKAWEENGQILILKQIFFFTFFIVLATIKTCQVWFCQPVVFNKKNKTDIHRCCTPETGLAAEPEANKSRLNVLSRHCRLENRGFICSSHRAFWLYGASVGLYIRFYGAEMFSMLQKSYLGSFFSWINQKFATYCRYSNIPVSRCLGPVYMTAVPCLCRLSRLSVSRSWTRSWRGYPRCPSEITEVLWKTCTPCTSLTVTRGGSITSNRWLLEAAWSVTAKKTLFDHNILI